MHRCRATSAHTRRQSRSNSGLGFQVNVLQTFSLYYHLYEGYVDGFVQELTFAKRLINTFCEIRVITAGQAGIPGSEPFKNRLKYPEDQHVSLRYGRRVLRMIHEWVISKSAVWRAAPQALFRDVFPLIKIHTGCTRGRSGRAATSPPLRTSTDLERAKCLSWQG